MEPLAILAGFGIGAIVGLTGVGGGSLMTPLLIGVFHLELPTAIGTDLGFAGLTKAGGGWAHWALGHVDLRITALLLAGSLPATLAMIGWMHLSGGAPGWPRAITLTLGIALLLTALSVALRGSWQALGRRLEQALPARRKAACTVAAGALLGVLVSLSSIGAGAIGATLLLLLYPYATPQRIVGTDIAHAVPLTLVAGLGHATLGNVDWALLGTLLIGSLPGIWIGARLTRRMPQAWVRSGLCLALTTAGIKVLA